MPRHTATDRQRFPSGVPLPGADGREMGVQEQAVQPEHGAGALDVPDETLQLRPRYHVGDPLPARLTVADMCWVFEMASSTFYRLAKRGQFHAFEDLPRIGGRRWSGVAVDRYMRTHPSERFGFGRRKAS